MTLWKAVLLSSTEQFCHVITQMVFCYALIYFLLPKFLKSKKYLLFTCFLSILSIGVYWIYYFEHILIFKPMHYYVGLKFRPPSVVYWFTLISFFTYFPISAGLVIAIKTLKNFYNKQKENQLLIKENANAELQLLKAQIHPHFLFNTLNNIYSFTLNKSIQAPQLVMNLSDTLRYMIDDCDAAFVPLEKELKMIQDHIGLEKVRYGDRLAMDVSIEGDYKNKFIAPLLLIPFVENCFKHGISMMRGKQWIRLSVLVEDKVLEFHITNSKPLLQEHTKSKGGIGLINVKKRLALLYPGKHQLNIISNANDYSVELQIQLQTPIVTSENSRLTTISVSSYS
ncbi:MAG: histidine kinase [Segetibacter sp.]